jgi:Mg/Co/Ni transporter MgtE
MVIVQFLTMLVGAGGNAGNQASVRVIRGLAVGTLNERTLKPFLMQEVKMAFGLSALLGSTGFIRAALFRTPVGETIAVTASLCAIVAISVALGSTLPLAMKKVGIDPAHSSTTIQVLMDITGVLITVCVSSVVLSFKVFMHDEDSVGGEDEVR